MVSLINEIIASRVGRYKQKVQVASHAITYIHVNRVIVINLYGFETDAPAISNVSCRCGVSVDLLNLSLPGLLTVVDFRIPTCSNPN